MLRKFVDWCKDKQQKKWERYTREQAFVPEYRVDKLTQEEFQRMVEFVHKPAGEKREICERRGRETAQVVNEEFQVLVPREEMQEFLLASIRPATGFLAFMTMRHGMTWGLVATDDEFRMEAHAYYLQWMRMKASAS